MRGGIRQLAVELRRPDVDTVEQRSALEMQRERDDGDGACPRQLRGEVGGRIGDDGDPAAGHCESSSGCASVSRRCPLRRNRRSSNGFTAKRTMTTITVTYTATP